MENGKIIYQMKTPQQTRKHVQDELDTLWEENKRLLNPQGFIINLSPALQKVKHQLLCEHSAKREEKVKTFDFSLER